MYTIKIILGPDFWGTKFQQCVGKHQSPINIDEHKVETVDFLPIKYENFEEDGYLSMVNNGHTGTEELDLRYYYE